MKRTSRIRRTVARRSPCLIALLLAWSGGWEQATAQDLTPRVTFAIHDPPRYYEPVHSVAFSSDGKILGYASTGTVKLHDAATLKNLCPPGFLDPQDGGSPMVLAPDGRTVATNHETGGIYIFDLQNWKREKGFGTRQESSITSLAYSPDGKVIAAGNLDHTIALLDLATGMAIRKLHRHIGVVRCLAFAPEGNILASGAEDNNVRLWDSENGRALNILGGHRDTVTSLAFASGGKTLASGSRDGTVRIWDLATGRSIATLKGEGDDMSAVAFRPDGKTLATAGRGTAIRLWDVDAKLAVATLDGHKASLPGGPPFRFGGTVHALAFSPDGKTLASCGEDGDVLLWDVDKALAAKPAK